MTKPFNQTKLIWTLSQAYFSAQKTNDVANFFVDEKVDALRTFYTPTIVEPLQKLRSAVAKKFKEGTETPQHTPGNGVCPFLIEMVGRVAFTVLPKSQLDLPTGSKLKVTLNCDPSICAQRTFSRFHFSKDKTTEVGIVFSSQDMVENFEVGSILNFSYGTVEARVLEISPSSEGTDIHCLCEVIEGGALRTGMVVRSPSLQSHLFPLLPHDKELLACAFEDWVDYVVIKGLKNLDQLAEIQSLLTPSQGGETKSLRHPTVSIQENVYRQDGQLPAKLIFMVDSKEALDIFPSALLHVDGVLLNRSELGLSCHPHDLPVIQKEMIATCHRASKCLLVESELMQSMTVNINPTRAEVSDVSNAALDGADGIVVSSQVATGPFGKDVARVTLDTLKNAEAWFQRKWHPLEKEFLQNEDDAITYGALRMAENCQAKAVVCLTAGGYTAHRFAAMKTPVQTIAVTYHPKIMRQLHILHGVFPVQMKHYENTEDLVASVSDMLKADFNFQKGDQFVFISLSHSTVSDKKSNIFSLLSIDD